MKPDAAKAEEILSHLLEPKTWVGASASDLIMPISEALGYLRGYQLPRAVLKKYVCTFCGKKGVKLWRSIGSSNETWCSACGMAQAGYPDTVDEKGRNNEGDFGRSDQIYSSKQGLNLLPYVPAPDGGTWAYTAVPPEACLWWDSLPTR